MRFVTHLFVPSPDKVSKIPIAWNYRHVLIQPQTFSTQIFAYNWLTEQRGSITIIELHSTIILNDFYCPSSGWCYTLLRIGSQYAYRQFN